MQRAIKKAVPQSRTATKPNKLYTIRVNKSIIARNIDCICGIIFLVGIMVMIWGSGLL